jgi:cleavage and polyadenylation specificity factor subunit 2
MAAATRSIAQPLHVGDFRLADLRKLLQGSGHSAEFRGEGTLLVDGLVAVRKTAIGKIEVEGGSIKSGDLYARSSAEGSFYAVKRKIYEGLAVVAGG